MERVFGQAKSPFSRADEVAIAIDRKREHIGLYHSAPQKQVNQLHLAFHNDLRLEPIDNKFSVWVKPAISPEIAFAVAAFCRKFAKAQALKQLPYGFSPPKGALAKTGHLEDGVVGLTCASLALAIFERCDAPLLEYGSWPIRDADVQWQQNVAERYLRPLLSKEELDRLLSEVPSVRYKPLEVAAAASSDTLPQNYDLTVSLIPRFSDLAAKCEQ